MDHPKQEPLTRRTALAAMAGAAGSALALGGAARAEEAAPPIKGRLKQSVCKWCYPRIPLEDLAKAAVDIGLQGVELLGPDEWPIVLDHGLEVPMANGPGPIHQGWNDPNNHERLIAESKRLLPLVAEAGLPNMIVFSGNRRDISDEDGLANCAAGLKQIMPIAEDLGVNVVLEPLNSKRDHRDYMADNTPWSVALVHRVESDNFKLLYDIYHMQIMEGDIIQTIVDNLEHICHFHTGGVPGRNEIDETQELNYRRICEVLVEQEFDGFVGQEFIPKGDPLESLRAAVQLCDV